MIDEADRAAIAIMAHICEDMVAEQKVDGFPRFQGMKLLYHAIRHLAYPDRGTFPKTRRGTKRHPVNLYHGQRDDLR